MPAISTSRWAFLLLMPKMVLIQTLRQEDNEPMCCCTTTIPDDGCEKDSLYVPRTGQCCKLMGSCNENANVFASFTTYFSGVYKKTKNPKKCVAGAKVQGGVYSGQPLVTPDDVTAKIQIQKSGQTEWEDLTESNWNKVGAFRLKAYAGWATYTGFSKLKDDENIVFALDVLHHGVKVPELSKQYTVHEFQNGQFRPGAVHFTEAHERKEFWVTLRYWKMNKEQASPAIEQHRLLYAAPTKVCGVSFFQSAHRNCNGPASEPKLALSKEIPGYALGVEYELVGAKYGAKGTSSALIENENSFDENKDTQSAFAQVNNSDPGHSMIELDANTSSVSRVDGSPCTGPCLIVKQCLWKKLGWGDDQKDAWHMEEDATVSAMTASQTTEVLQHSGVPFEIVSPGPPHVLVGQKGMLNAVKVLSAVHDMGAQAPLSAGLHLHVNVRNKNVGAEITLSLKQIMAVFISWARFQLIIDEIISPDRVGNWFAKGFYLLWGLEAKQATALKAIFKRIHEKVWRMTKAEDDRLTTTEACLALIGPGWLKWCERDYFMSSTFHMMDNPEKYFQINLTPLGRFGTIEFRAGSATLDVNRAARWFQFLVGFVHTFKNTEYSEMFFNNDVETDWQELATAQMLAKPEELKKYMAANIEDDFFEYFTEKRPFETEPDTGCVKLGL